MLGVLARSRIIDSHTCVGNADARLGIRIFIVPDPRELTLLGKVIEVRRYLGGGI